MSCTPGKEIKVEAVLAIEGRCINYQTVATRCSASVIKMSMQMGSDAFIRRLGTFIISI